MTVVDTPTKIRVAIIDDHDMVRKGLSLLLKCFEDFELVGNATNGRDALALCKECQPNVVLMDLIMPKFNGIEAMKQIIAHYPDTQIIALTNFQDEELVHNALKAGATSYVLKNVSVDELARTIRDAYQGKSTLAPEVAQMLIKDMNTTRPPDSNLSEREIEVLKLVALGRNNGEIGDRLNISTSTVKNHISNILTKLDVSNRAAAVHTAMLNRLI